VTYEETEDEDSLKDDLQSEVESEYEHTEEDDDEMVEEKAMSRPRKFRSVRLRVLKLIQKKIY
jgi:hypothetical protein